MRRVIAFSGAGVSADSGLPTYRGERGIWSDIPAEEVSFYPTWRQNFQKVHEYHDENRVQLKHCKPNAMHVAVGSWQKRFGSNRVLNITQNTDDLFEKAGCKETLHLHGKRTEMFCERCEHFWDVGYIKWFDEGSPCPECWSTEDVRPNVIFFNEIAPEYDTLKEIGAATTEDDMLIVMGTSGTVVPIDRYFNGVFGRLVLNDIAPTSRISHLAFDYVISDRAPIAAQRVGSLVDDWLG